VAVLQFGDGGSDAISFPWLGLPGSHNIAHPGGERKAKADAWIFSQWAYLLERMKAEKEGGRSLLDSSVALFLNNMAEGNHSFTAVPAFLAGSAGGYFKTGRALKTAGGFHQPLLVSVANAVGVPLTSFGDPEYNSGEMPGLRG
jgi:hypothetical protein